MSHTLVDAVWAPAIIWHLVSCGACSGIWFIQSNHYVGHVEHPDLEDQVRCPHCETAQPIRMKVKACS